MDIDMEGSEDSYNMVRIRDGTERGRRRQREILRNESERDRERPTGADGRKGEDSARQTAGRQLGRVGG